MITIVLCSIFGVLIVGILFIVDELRQIKAILSTMASTHHSTPGE